MKILQVIDTLKIGGAEQIAVLLANLLKSQNIKVSVLILVEEGALIDSLDKEIPVRVLKRQSRFDRHTLKQTAQLMDTFDIIHVHLKHNYRYTALATKLYGKKEPNIILHDHSHYLGVAKTKSRQLKDGLLKSILKPRYFIGVNQFNIDWASEVLGINPKYIFLLPNTISKKQIEISNCKREGMVLVSNISRVKNIEFAIKLTCEIDQHLTIYGRVRDQVYFDELLLQIKNLNYQDKVKFIQNCNDIQSELHKFKFAIHTSHKETGPLVLIEYLAQGLPFLSSATGEVYSTVKKEIPDNFVEEFNLDMWINGINKLHFGPNPHLQDIYNTYFSSESYIKKCLNIYQSILNS